jgi:ribonuclease-3
MVLGQFLRLGVSSKQDPLFKFVQNITGTTPKDLSLYKRVFTHSSMEKIDEDGKKINYERLEFLGDSLISAIVATHLFREMPQNNEGSLTLMRSKIVRREFLNKIGAELGLISHLSSNVPKENYGKDIHGNMFEAIVGAVYLDVGFEACRSFVYNVMITPHVNLSHLHNRVLSYKSLLVDWFQKNKLAFRFDTFREERKGEKNYYMAKLWVDGRIIASAGGANKKKATEKAAKRGYYHYQHRIKEIKTKH